MLFSCNTCFLARDFTHAQPKNACNDTRQTSETRQLSSGIENFWVLMLEYQSKICTQAHASSVPHVPLVSSRIAVSSAARSWVHITLSVCLGCPSLKARIWPQVFHHFSKITLFGCWQLLIFHPCPLGITSSSYFPVPEMRLIFLS